MKTVYDIKPLFQQLLRPFVKKIFVCGITPNQITLFTLVFCFVYAAILSVFVTSTVILALYPIVLLLRMALNAIDGILAKEYALKTHLGVFLNELADMASDSALYLPFSLYPGVHAGLVVLIVILSLMSEAAGLSALQIGAKRRYDGPMGKSDRAVVFSLFAIGLAFFNVACCINWMLGLTALLIGLTMVNRVVKSLKEANN